MLNRLARLWYHFKPSSSPSLLPALPVGVPKLLRRTMERQRLLDQISRLQQQVAQLDSVPGPRKPKKTKQHDSDEPIGPLPAGLAAAPKRHIALKFVYDGWCHSGLAYQPVKSYTPLTTVEGCILKALEAARLIEPAREDEGFGCGFERCGRTDAGVSSSAQVINLWVRSDLEDPMGIGLKDENLGVDEARPPSPSGSDVSASLPAAKSKRKPSSTTEIPYITMLNRHLPPTIRMIAWSPVSATFSSRYSCVWRHYKYFFSTSPLAPFRRPRPSYGSAYDDAENSTDNLADLGWEGLELDVDRMREAVKHLVGEHDFRNLCKVDPPKQLPTHRRTVISASIDPVEGEGDDMFVLNLRGGAFLYNQVRHIVALLLHIGAGLESPSLIPQLLWTSDRPPNTNQMHSSFPPLPLMDTKPSYGMADDLPLVLWDCGFAPGELSWRLDDSPKPDKAIEVYRRHFLDMNQQWTQARLKTIIGRHHLSAMAEHAPLMPEEVEMRKLVWTPHGAGQYTKTSGYIPFLQRRRGDLPEDVNRRWAEGRGRLKVEKREANKEEADRVREANLKKKVEALKAVGQVDRSEALQPEKNGFESS